jgi:hypothetical protein
MSSLWAAASVAAVSGCPQQRNAAGRRASRGTLQVTAAAGASAAAGVEAALEPSALSRRQVLGAAAAASLVAAGAGSVGTGGSWVAPLPAEAAALAPLGGIERVGGDKLTGLTAEQVKVRRWYMWQLCTTRVCLLQQHEQRGAPWVQGSAAGCTHVLHPVSLEIPNSCVPQLLTGLAGVPDCATLQDILARNLREGEYFITGGWVGGRVGARVAVGRLLVAAAATPCPLLGQT